MTIFPFSSTSAFVLQLLLFTLVKKREKILSWSILHRQFNSAFFLTASKGSRTGKANLPLICASVPSPVSLHGSDSDNIFYSLRPLYFIILLNLDMWYLMTNNLSCEWFWYDSIITSCISSEICEKCSTAPWKLLFFLSVLWLLYNQKQEQGVRELINFTCVKWLIYYLSNLKDCIIGKSSFPEKLVRM
jgi:hypothetical protein